MTEIMNLNHFKNWVRVRNSISSDPTMHYSFIMLRDIVS